MTSRLKKKNVEKVFQDRYSNGNIEPFVKGRLHMSVKGLYRSQEDLIKKLIDCKGLFSKVMQNIEPSRNKMQGTFLDYLKGGRSTGRGRISHLWVLNVLYCSS